MLHLTRMTLSHFIVTLWVANMKKIQDYVNRIDEELSDAKEYAEKYVECKAEGKDSTSRKYKEMAEDELKHANYIHEISVAENQKLRERFSPTQHMFDEWEKSHKEMLKKQPGLSRC